MQWESLNPDDCVLAPGPVNLHPAVQRALSLPMIHHRTPEFDEILARVLKKMRAVFHTEQPVFLLSSTGSGGMEALLVNTLSPGDRVLAINSGKFGERWAEMARGFGMQVDELHVEWGHAVKVGDVAQMLKDGGNYRAVLCQACETSTGVAHPVRELGEIIHSYPETLFLVDGIAALGAYPLPMDQWFIDGLVGGSQKAFMLPAGMSFVSFSQKAWKFVESAKCPRYYFDVRREKKANEKGETFFSSNVTIIRALDVVLNLIDEKGWDKHFLEISKRAQFIRYFAPKLGLINYSLAPSNSLTALSTPPVIDSQKARLMLEEKFKITVMGGQDQAKGKILRIGHMGHVTQEQMIRLMMCLGEVLAELTGSTQLKNSLKEMKIEMKGWWGGGAGE